MPEAYIARIGFIFFFKIPIFFATKKYEKKIENFQKKTLKFREKTGKLIFSKTHFDAPASV